MTRIPGRIVFRAEQNSHPLPLYTFKVPAGFPSPAADHIEKHISLDELFEIRASHIHALQVPDDSMIGAGLCKGDLMIVDGSRNAEPGDIVTGALNDEPVCLRLQSNNACAHELTIG